jgi:hypothetical protein
VKIWDEFISRPPIPYYFSAFVCLSRHLAFANDPVICESASASKRKFRFSPMAESMTPLDLVKLARLMKLTAGSSEIVVGLIDGPVAINHPDLGSENIRETHQGARGVCSQTASAACLHGTFVAGILCAKRGSNAPAICPSCTLIVRPVFDLR